MDYHRTAYQGVRTGNRSILPYGESRLPELGDSRMELILRILGVGPGDEVITSAYTYTATASVTCHVGAKVVLIDTAPGSFEMDYDKLADAITEKTKVVIPVDLAGIVCDYDRIFAAVESRKQLFRPSNELQRAFGRSSFLRTPPTLSEQNVRAGSAAKSPISPHFPFMR